MENNKPNQPNIIVFFTDQQRWDTTGVHGNPLELTPNFDRIAKQGTHLYHSFTSDPICGPARATLQTGLYGSTTGYVTNNAPLPSDQKTIAHYFREAGYRTGYIGKWHLSDQEPVPEEHRGGYEYWLAANMLEISSDVYDTVVYNNDNQEVFLPGYRVDALTDAGIKYMTENRDKPFFMFLSYLEPHQQNHLDSYPAPLGYEERYQGRWMPGDLASLGGTAHSHIGGYYGMVKRLDEALSRIIDALISMKLMEDTIILFTSDHGCHFRTRHHKGMKNTCHESSIRTPAALIGREFTGGGELRQFISLIDLPPTLLDAAGIEVPSYMQGRSILPLVKRQQSKWPKEVLIQLYGKHAGRAIRNERWKYCVLNRGDGPDEYEEAYLYDLLADPHELVNLIDHEAMEKVTEVLQAQLTARMVEVGENAPNINKSKKNVKSTRRVSVSDLRLKGWK